MKPPNPSKSTELTFDDFRKRAADDSLSQYEKIGFPDSYREGKEDLIFADVRRKLTNLEKQGQTILDIGPGCSGPAFSLIEWCRQHRHRLVLIDSQEMLSRLPDEAFVEKFSGKYPAECGDIVEKYCGRIDAVICYSVLHYVFVETNLFDFLDHSLSLLADGGEMLIGDIPNQSQRKRFFSSRNGVKFHQAFTGTNEKPEVSFNSVETGKRDDSVLIGIILRARAAGYDAYLLPQPSDLPMANRREDILIKKP